MLRIRMRRVGAKKHPSYRIVVAESGTPRGGVFVAQVGHYDPSSDPPTVTLDEERVRHWLSQGAQPSTPVALLLRSRGIPGEG